MRINIMHEFNVSSAQLKALGYTEGATLLTFACWNTTGRKTTGVGDASSATIVFDDISYCEMLDTPEVTVSGNTANWPAVEGAQSYTVFVNGVEKVTVTTTTFDLTALTETAKIQVRANANAEGVTSSSLSLQCEYVVTSV